jgi:YD repeat-containing protein
MSYTPSGQLASVTDPLNHTTSFSYSAGDLASVTDPLGRTVAFATDALGRVIAVTDSLGNTTRTTYDALDRLAHPDRRAAGRVSYGYDANSNLTIFTDARNNVTGYLRHAQPPDHQDRCALAG